jgi:NTE family protein
MCARKPKRLVLIVLGLVLGLAGCSALKLKNEPVAHWDPGAGPRSLRQVAGARSGDLLLAVAFSGGGTRAAAFAYGVLEELRDTRVLVEGRHRRLLDEIDLVSGVSGGSFPAAYYGLYGDRIFVDFERRFLKNDVEGVLIARLFRPKNWVRLFSPYFGRGELAAEYYDEELFHGATFGDLTSREEAPYVLINATDLSSGSRFSFNQGFFSLICSDLAKFPVSVAVTASSAVPVLFSPVTLRNYAGTCGFEPPAWVKAALTDPDASVRRRLYAQLGLSFLDSKHRKYIHLLDGGIADNLGIRALFERLVLEGGNLGEVLQETGHGHVRDIVFLVINSQTEPEYNWDISDLSPTLPDILGAVTSVQINRYNFETLDIVRANFDQWSRKLSTADRSVSFHMIQVSFDDEKNEQQRHFFNNLPTSFSLTPEQVDKLKAAGRQLLKANPDFQRLVEKLSTPSPSSADATAAP